MRLLAGLLLAACAAAASLADSVPKLLSASPAARTAFWGVEVVDLATGKPVYQLNADHFFIPASNTKLFTTSLALTRLGPDFTFETRIVADAAPDAEGRIHGSLRLIGGGDPNLSARPIPYRMGAASPGNPLVAIEELADQVAAHGVKHIEGDIIGDDTWYVWEPYAQGWAIEDPLSTDGAPVSALTVNDNVLTLGMRPGARVGDLAVLTLQPPVEYYRIDNRLRTVAAGERKIHVERDPGSLQVRVWGTIPLRDRGDDWTLAIEDPAHFAALSLRQALADRGITIDGDALARHSYPGDDPLPAEPAVTELARRVSAPLLEDLRITNKASQNLHAELALRAVGRARRHTGSFEAGIEELKTFLTEAGVDAGGYFLTDGSGLARLNLVTPGTIVRLLRHMYASPARDNWISLLPVGGQDGTLSGRFGEGSLAGRIYAKTGTLSHVSALSGYLKRNDGSWVAFSILVNNYNGHAAEVRGVMDRICTLIVE